MTKDPRLDSGRPPHEALGVAAVGLVAVLILELGLARAGAVATPVGVVVATVSLAFGTALAAVTSWILRSGRAGATVTAVSATTVLPASWWYGATGSPVAFVLAALATAVLAVVVMMVAVVLPARVAVQLVDSRRARRGQPAVEDTIAAGMRRLPPDARSAVLLGMPTVAFLTVAVFVDPALPGQQGIAGAVAATFSRLFEVLRHLSIGVLASAIVLLARTYPITDDDEHRRSRPHPR